MKVLSKLKVFYNVIKHLNATLEDVVAYNRKVLLIDVLNKQTFRRGINEKLFQSPLGGAYFCNCIPYFIWETCTSVLSYNREYNAEYSSS